jgi:hypothetical protein
VKYWRTFDYAYRMSFDCDCNYTDRTPKPPYRSTRIAKSASSPPDLAIRRRAAVENSVCAWYGNGAESITFQSSRNRVYLIKWVVRPMLRVAGFEPRHTVSASASSPPPGLTHQSMTFRL